MRLRISVRRIWSIAKLGAGVLEAVLRHRGAPDILIATLGYLETASVSLTSAKAESSVIPVPPP